MAEIKGILQDLNPWWGGKFEIEFQDRDLYEQIQKFIPLRQIIAFTGLRRVGKTTLMLKIAEDFTKEFDAKRIIYFSFDEFREIELRELIRKYEELLENDFRKGKYLLLLDEIQKLTDWENKLKGIYDAFGKNVKIIISGSESLFIKKKSKETLAGRIFEFKIETLSFKEFLSFKKFDFKNVNLREKELKFLFNKFTLTQGFPELVEIEEKEIIRKYIRENVIERVLYRDIQKVFKIKDASKVESLFNLFLEEPGQLADVSELANELGISRQTVSNYLNCLEKSFLIRKLYNFSRSRRKIERKLKKYYPVVISPNLLFNEDVQSKSKAFEWVMVNQLRAEFFWRDPYKNEVDIVVGDGKIIPIEVKYGKIDFGGMLAFMKKFNVNEGYIISHDKEEKKKIDKKIVHVIPAFKFLLEKKFINE